MTIEGYIYGKNNEPVKATVTVELPAGAVETLEIEAGNKYRIDYAETELRQTKITFSAAGHRTIETTGAELIDTGSNIHLEKSNSAVVLILAAGLLYAFSNSKKKVGSPVALLAAQNPTVKKAMPFILVGGGVLAFFVLKDILEKLGIWKDKDERTVDDTSDDPESFWNPTMWQKKPAGTNYTNPITLSTAKSYANEIYQATGVFDDCEECIKSVFRRLPSQAAASYVAFAFDLEYSMDLLNFLKGGTWPQDRLSYEDIAEITRYVTLLPKY